MVIRIKITRKAYFDGTGRGSKMLLKVEYPRGCTLDFVMPSTGLGVGSSLCSVDIARFVVKNEVGLFKKGLRNLGLKIFGIDIRIL